MSATEHGTGTFDDNAPEWRKVKRKGAGEVKSDTWRGERSRVEDKYDALVADMDGGGNISEVDAGGSEGRCYVIARYGRTGNVSDDYGEDVTVIEELYGIDVMKDIWNAPYFNTGGAGVLTDDKVSAVRKAVQNFWTEAEIDAEFPTALKWTNWSNAMKELRYHMAHGNESFLETGFILRRTMYGVRSSAIGATFSEINQVVTTNPTFSTEMVALVNSLPSGEWLKRPPAVEHLGEGRWRVSEEWHYAVKWSVVYGGTWKGYMS